ncbi:MAG: hypothetical protein PHV23_03815 [Candidatus Gracilibacteria bacterium]|nr:hypothetical protein [Candidatus Gracilibacteria bacterium]
MNPSLSENPGKAAEIVTKKVSEIKDAVLSEEQKEKYKDVILSMEQADRLKQGRLTVEELTRLHLEQFKKTRENYSPEKLNEALEAGKKEAIEAGKEAEQLGKKLGDSTIVKKAEEKAGELKDKASEIKEKVGEEGLMVWLEKIEKEGGIIGFLVGIFLGIARLLGYKSKLGDAAEKVKGAIEKLKPEEITKTKEETKKLIIGKLGKTLTPENQAKLESAINNLSSEELSSLYTKLKKGELNYSEILKIVPNLLKDVINPEQIEKTKKDVQESLINALKKEIKEKYNIELDQNKLLKLRELVEKNTTISKDTIGLFYEIGEKKEFKIKDFFGPGLEAGINTSSLMIGLLINGIIPISAFGMDFAKAGTDMIRFSIDALGVGSSISIDNFNKSIEGMNESEKAILIGLLYRKGGLFLNMVGSISESVSRLGIAFLTNTSVKGYETIGASLTGNYGKQAENFAKIAKNISPEIYKDAEDILKKSTAALGKLEENYKIIDIFQKSEGNIETATKLLTDAKIKIPSGINTSDFNKFVEGFKPAMEYTFEGLSKGSITSKLGFGASADLFDLENKIQKVTQAQRRLLNGNFLTKGIAKLRELSEIGEISRLGDRMVLHFESKDAALKGISKWNILANKFPEIVKGCLDKLPIIAVAGIAANSDKPFFEEFRKEMKYIFPIIGPIWLIGDSGLNWEDGMPKITNGLDAGIGGALLAVDTVFLIKEMSKSGLKGGIGYLFKPIKDIYSIGRGSAEGIYSISKAISSGKTLSSIFKESVIKSKSIKNTKLRAIAIIGLLGYAGYSMAFEDNSLKEVFGKDGKLDREKLKDELPNLSDEEKLVCIKYILSESQSENFLKDVDFKIKNNTLYVKSQNENIQGDWFIDDDIKQTLGLNHKVEFSYEKKPA